MLQSANLFDIPIKADTFLQNTGLLYQ